MQKNLSEFIKKNWVIAEKELVCP